MEYTESILWWILIEKLFLKAKYLKKIGDFVCHQLEILGKGLNDRHQNKLDMLHSFGIPMKYHIATNYQDGYLHIAEKIKSGSRARYKKQPQEKIKKDANLIDDRPVKPKQNPYLLMPADQL